MRFPEKPRVGLVASKARGWTSHAGAKLLRRSSATFVAVLCENEAVQKCLPSFVLCNKHLCPKNLYEDLLAAAPPSPDSLPLAETTLYKQNIFPAVHS